MFHCLLCVVVLASFSSQAQPLEIEFPARVTDTLDGACPTGEQLVAVRQQIMNDVVAAMTPGLTQGNPVSSCSAIPSTSPSGTY